MNAHVDMVCTVQALAGKSEYSKYHKEMASAVCLCVCVELTGIQHISSLGHAR